MDAEGKKIICPDCGAVIDPPAGWLRLEVGDILECANCGSEVEIQSLKPLKYAVLVEEK